MPHRRAPHGEDAFLAAAARPDSVPSDVAKARLSGALRDRADEYRSEAAVDLTIVDALLRLDEFEAAARQLDDHRASLQAMAHDLQVAVADAAVEREAERVYQACAEALEPPAPPANALRRRVLAVASAAAVALAIMLPSGRLSPRTTLASLVDRRPALNDIAVARERLEAARSLARALRSDTAESRARPRAQRVDATSHDIVRHKVRSILAADAPGGSAATTSTDTATVTSLSDVQAKRRPPPPDSTAPEDPKNVAPVVPLPQRGPEAPRPPQPPKDGVSVDTTAVEKTVEHEIPDVEPDPADVSAELPGDQ